MGARGETDQGPTDAQLAVLQALWTGVVNDWDDEDRHTRFLDHAREIGALPEAARRYGALRDDPERGELARKRLQAIALLATNELYATRTSRPSRRTPGWLVAVAVAVCVALLGWAALAFGVASR
ncbi:MAG: hypothetical protein HYV09_01085 [Deltaproteobacteria bacterium]|nr:hypothetical protein [Deltaproteobacteria bacterium]